jgi:hypothetical protein
MAKTNKLYKSSKKVAHTQYDNRYTQANRINNKNSNCCKCGTKLIASQLDDIVTVKCSNFSFSGKIELCINYKDIFCDFIDNHP